MRTVLTSLFAAILFVLGCWTPGDVQENLPKHREKFPKETVFFIMKTEPRVMKTLSDALKARGFKCTSAALNFRKPCFSVVRPLFCRYWTDCNSLNMSSVIMDLRAWHASVSFIRKGFSS